MVDDIEKALAYQVKKDIAERYFGYRKVIEEDQQELERIISRIKDFYMYHIGPSLMRIYCLLKKPELADELMDLIKWMEKPFYKEFLESKREEKESLFEGFSQHGFTDFMRYKNLLMDSYERLYEDVERYRDLIMDAKDEAEVINQEIISFRGKFSLDEILSFIRCLDKREDLAAVLGENLPSATQADIEDQLKIDAVPDPEEMLPRVSDVPPLSEIKGRLKELAKLAYKINGEN